VPVLVTIFNTRLRMLEHVILNQETPDALQVKADLQEQLRRIPRDAFRPAYGERGIQDQQTHPRAGSMRQPQLKVSQQNQDVQGTSMNTCSANWATPADAMDSSEHRATSFA
jgi:hypothetical protein